MHLARLTSKMPPQEPKPARVVAMMALNQFDAATKGQVYVGPILNKLLEQTDERQRATDLVFGTIRNRAAIDMVIAKLGDRPVDRIAAKLLNIIRIGAYELVYSPTTPEYSIVNEAVENTKVVGGKKQTGFVNAVLRQIGRHITNREASLSKSNARRTLSQTPSAGCEFDIDILPEPKASPADYFGTAFSLPKWLVSDWLGKFGPERTGQICFASNRKPSTYARANRLRTTTEEIAARLHQAGIECDLPPDESMVRIKGPRAVTQLPGFAEGLFSVQDLTASQVVKALQPQPGWTILDLCAAPGVKTTQLAESTGDSAKIIATDIDNERLKMVKENIARLGIKSVDLTEYNKLKKVAEQTGPFDAVLLDVPCSNTGVLARRVEARYRIRPTTATKLAKTQYQLLETAAAMIKPQGKICYSTCSIQEPENGQLVRRFVQKHPNFRLESEVLTLPSAEDFDHDGGYVAIVTKK
ncbi:MAG: transcription antitermination factor NusB [Planctomycetota bacterium]